MDLTEDDAVFCSRYNSIIISIIISGLPAINQWHTVRLLLCEQIYYSDCTLVFLTHRPLLVGNSIYDHVIHVVLLRNLVTRRKNPARLKRCFSFATLYIWNSLTIVKKPPYLSRSLKREVTCTSTNIYNRSTFYLCLPSTLIFMAEGEVGSVLAGRLHT